MGGHRHPPCSDSETSGQGNVSDIETQSGPGGTAVELTLANEGQEAISDTLTQNDYTDRTQTVTVKAASSLAISWPTDQYGYYGVVITANTSDGFRRCYAGRVA